MTSRAIGKSGSPLAFKTHWGQSPPYLAQIKKEITMKVITHQSHSTPQNFQDSTLGSAKIIMKKSEHDTSKMF